MLEHATVDETPSHARAKLTRLLLMKCATKRGTSRQGATVCKNADGRTRTADLRVMKAESNVSPQGVAGEEQRGRQQEADAIDDWIRKCPVVLSCRTSDAIKLLLGLPQ